MTVRAPYFLLSIFIVCWAVGAAAFSAQEVLVVESQELVLTIGDVPVPEVSAQSYLVFEAATGKALLAQTENKVRPIASITKLFSAASVLAQGKLTATTSVTWSDLATEGESGKLEPFDIYSNRDLLWPLLLESSNDAAAALARSNPELLKAMNNHASELGLRDTAFADASGLSADNISTARELAVLSLSLYQQQPHLFDITQLPQYIGSQTGWVNNSPFIGEPNYRGGKHGFTYEANRTAVAFFEEELNSGQTQLFGYVLLGSEDLVSDMQILRHHITQNARLE